MQPHLNFCPPSCAMWLVVSQFPNQRWNLGHAVKAPYP